jgi:hypothetical protein
MLCQPKKLKGITMLDQTAFHVIFPQAGELGSFYLPSPPKDLGSTGPYQMIDLFCQDYTCDCHKVSIVIVDAAKKSVLATVAYGWKSKGYYYKWGLDKETAELLSSGFLDPFGVQTLHGSTFLRFIRHKINSDPRFMSQIKKRYRLFKEYVSNPSFTPIVFSDPPLPDNVIPLNLRQKR